MARVKLYSTGRCPICDKTKQLLSKWQISYQEIRVDNDHQGLREMLRISNNARTVPQIAIDDNWIGGFTELTELHMEDKLDHLVEG